MGLKTLRRPYDSDEDLNKRSEQLNIDKLDKKFDKLLKQWDADRIQKWLDSNV